MEAWEDVGEEMKAGGTGGLDMKGGRARAAIEQTWIAKEQNPSPLRCP